MRIGKRSGSGGGGTGTVTSVALAMPLIFSVTGSPITTSGTLTVAPVSVTGDIIYADASNSLARRAIGSPGDVLTVSGGLPVWAAPASAAVSSVFGRTGAVVAVAGDYGPTLGGTGQTVVATGDLLYGSAANTWSRRAATTNGFVLTLVAGVPDWAAVPADAVTSVFGRTGAVVAVAGDYPPTKGGTGQTIYVVGDILYADTTTTLARKAIGASGQVLVVSGGVPSWVSPGGASGIGTVTSVALAAPTIFSVSGSPVTSSGTLTLTASCATGDIIYGSAANTYSKLPIGTAGQALVVAGSAPSWGAVGVTGGGTGLAAVTSGNILYGNGTSALNTLAVAGQSGKFLTNNGSVPQWATVGISGGGTGNLAMSQGDLFFGPASGDVMSVLSVAGQSGKFLTNNGSVLQWAAAAGSGTVTSVSLSMPNIFAVSGSPVTTSGTLSVTADCATGDLIYGSATNTYSKRAIGTTGFVLTVVAGVPNWAAVVCPATAFVTLTDGATITVTASGFPVGQCGIGKVTLGGNRTLSFSGGTAGQRIELWIKQDATGSRTLAYDSSCAFATGLPSPTLSTAANAKDKQMWEYDDVAAKWNLMAIVKGF